MGARESVSDDEPHVESSSLGSSLGAPNKAKGGTPSKRGPPRKRGPKPGDDYDRPQRRSAALAVEEEDLERLLRQREAAKLKEVLPSKVSKTAIDDFGEELQSKGEGDDDSASNRSSMDRYEPFRSGKILQVPTKGATKSAYRRRRSSGRSSRFGGDGEGEGEGEGEGDGDGDGAGAKEAVSEVTAFLGKLSSLSPGQAEQLAQEFGIERRPGDNVSARLVRFYQRLNEDVPDELRMKRRFVARVVDMDQVSESQREDSAFGFRQGAGELLFKAASSPDSPDSQAMVAQILEQNPELWRFFRGETTLPAGAFDADAIRGYTPLHAAVLEQNRFLADQLLEAGADPDYDPLGLNVTPLMALLADPKRSPSTHDMASRLLEAGADASLRQLPYGTATTSIFHTAVSLPKSDRVRSVFIDHFEMTDIAKACEDDPDAVEKHFLRRFAGSGKMAAAMRSGDLESIRSVLNRGVDPNHHGKDGKSWLFQAVAKLNLEVIRLLIQVGADVSHRSSQGTTPIFELVDAIGRKESQPLYDTAQKVLWELLKNGARVDEFAHGPRQTPLGMAVVASSALSIRLFLEHGANPFIHVTSPKPGKSIFMHADEEARAVIVDHFGVSEDSIATASQDEIEQRLMGRMPETSAWDTYLDLELVDFREEGVLTLRAWESRMEQWLLIHILHLCILPVPVEDFQDCGDNPCVCRELQTLLHIPIGPVAYEIAERLGWAEIKSPYSVVSVFERSFVPGGISLRGFGTRDLLAPESAVSEEKCRVLFLQLVLACEDMNDGTRVSEYLSLGSIFVSEDCSQLCVSPMKMLLRDPQMLPSGAEEGRELSSHVWSAAVALLAMHGAVDVFAEPVFTHKQGIIHTQMPNDAAWLVAQCSRRGRLPLGAVEAALLERMFDPEPQQRITFEDVLKHPWLTDTPIPKSAIILALRAARREQSLPLRSTRFNIVGQARAGKTSFLKAMKGERFDPNQASTRAGDTTDVKTVLEADIGADVSTALVKGCKWVEIDGVKDENYEMALRQDAARRFGQQKAKKRAPPQSAPPEAYGLEEMKTPDSDAAGDRKEPSSSDEAEAKGAASSAASDFKSPDTEAKAVEHSLEAKSSDAEAAAASTSPEEEKAEQIDDWEMKGEVALGEDDHLTLAVFDFGGQRIFQCMQNLFLSRFGVYAVVFNLEDFLQQTPPALDDLDYWLRALKLYAPSCSVLIIGTHKDTILSELYAKREAACATEEAGLRALEDFNSFCEVISTRIQSTFGSSLLQNAVPYEEANADSPLLFHPLSCKNVDDSGEIHEDPILAVLRQKVKRLAVSEVIRDPVTKDVLPFVDQRLPVSWLMVADSLSNLSKETKIVSVLNGTGTSAMREPTVESLAERHGVISAADGPSVRLEKLKLMLKRLHEIARLFYYEEGPADLQERILLEPQWLLDSFSRVCRNFDLHPLILDSQAEKNEPQAWEDLVERGVLSRKLLPYLWGDSRLRFFDYLLAFLKAQALLVALDDDEETFLVPHLVSDLKEYTAASTALSVLPETEWDYVDGASVDGESTGDDGSDEPVVVAYLQFDEWLPRGFFERVVVRCIENVADKTRVGMKPGSARLSLPTGGLLELQREANSRKIRVALATTDFLFNVNVRILDNGRYVSNAKALGYVVGVMQEVNAAFYSGMLQWTVHVLDVSKLSFFPAELVTDAEYSVASTPAEGREGPPRYREDVSPTAAAASSTRPRESKAAGNGKDDGGADPSCAAFEEFLREAISQVDDEARLREIARKMQTRYGFLSNMLSEYKDQRVSESDLIDAYSFLPHEAMLFVRYLAKTLDEESRPHVQINAWYDRKDSVAREECSIVHNTVMNSRLFNISCHAAPFPFLEESVNKLKEMRCKVLHIAAHAGKDGCLKIPVDEDEPDEYAEAEELADCWSSCARHAGCTSEGRHLECVVLNNCHGGSLARGLERADVIFWDSKVNEQAAKKFARLFHKECVVTDWDFAVAFENACKTLSLRWHVDKDPQSYPSGKAKDGSSARPKRVAGLLRMKRKDGALLKREGRKLVEMTATPAPAPAPAPAPVDAKTDPSIPAPTPAEDSAVPCVALPALKSYLSERLSPAEKGASRGIENALMAVLRVSLPGIITENGAIMESLEFKRVQEMNVQLDKAAMKTLATYTHAIQLARLNSLKKQLQGMGPSFTVKMIAEQVLSSFKEKVANGMSRDLRLAGGGRSDDDDVCLLGKRLVLCVRLDAVEEPDTNMIGYKVLWLARPILAKYAGERLEKLYAEAVGMMREATRNTSWARSSSAEEDDAFAGMIRRVAKLDKEGDLRFHQIRANASRRPKEVRGLLDFARLFVGRLSATHLSSTDDDQASLHPTSWDIETTFQFLKVEGFQSAPDSSAGSCAALRPDDVQAVYSFRTAVMHQSVITEGQLQSMVGAVLRLLGSVSVLSPHLASAVENLAREIEAGRTANFVEQTDFKEFCLRYNARVFEELDSLKGLAMENLQMTKENNVLARENISLQRRQMEIMNLENDIRRCKEQLDDCTNAMQRASGEYCYALMNTDKSEADQWHEKLQQLGERKVLLDEKKTLLEEQRRALST